MEHSPSLVSKTLSAVALHCDDVLTAISLRATDAKPYRWENGSPGSLDLFCSLEGYQAPVFLNLRNSDLKPRGFVVTFADRALADAARDECPPSLEAIGEGFFRFLYLTHPTEDAFQITLDLMRDNCSAIHVQSDFAIPATERSDSAFSTDSVAVLENDLAPVVYDAVRLRQKIAPMIARMRGRLPTRVPLKPEDDGLGYLLTSLDEAHAAMQAATKVAKKAPKTAAKQAPKEPKPDARKEDVPAAKPEPITKQEVDTYGLMTAGAKRDVARGVIYAKARRIAATFTGDTLEGPIKGLLEKTLMLEKTEADALSKLIATKSARTPGAIARLRKDVRNVANKSDDKSGLDKDGWIQFGDESEFFVADFEGQSWIWRKGSKESGDRRVCQRFRISRVATAVGGKAQHLTITFGSPEGEMSVTFPRGDLPKYAQVGEVLLDAGFLCSDIASVSGILMPLAFAANALLIDRTGFGYSGNAFLRPDGRTMRHSDRKLPEGERPLLQSPGADRPSHLFTAGTREGYIAAIRPAFVDMEGRARNSIGAAFDPGPFPNVAFMAVGAAAGVIHTYANPLDGVLLPSIVAGSGSIKSIGAEVFVAGSGNPTSDQSGFFTWDATKAGLEVRLPRLSACNLGLDELRVARDPKQVEMMLWMLFAGKGGVRSNNTMGEPLTRVFGGVCVLTSEELLADYFARNKITPPPGFDARVVSIKYTRSMIPSQIGNAKMMAIIDGFHTGARSNYGHATEAAVNELLRMTADGETSPEALSRVLFGYRDELAAMVSDRQTMDSRAADLFATFRYSGELLQRLGFIPADYDVKALIEWTWLNCRVAGRVASTGQAAVDHFRATILGSADRIPEWDKDEWSMNGGDDYRGALAWKSSKKVSGVKREILMITEVRLAEIAKELTGGVTDLIEELEKLGALIHAPDAKIHRQRNGMLLRHYQIDLDKLLKAVAGSADDE